MRAAIVVAALVIGAGVARAERVAVRVVEVAGDVAYVEPGEAAGLAPGTEVRFGRRSYKVTTATKQHAAVRVGKGRLDVGDRGEAQVKAGERATAQKLPPPRALDAFRGQWPDARPPAAGQSPTHVPLGVAPRTGRMRADGWIDLLAIVSPEGEGEGEEDEAEGITAALEVGARATFDLWQEAPLAADVDVAARVYSAGYGGPRVPLFVRAAQLRWGSAADPRLAVGRLRWASSSTGMLDGARVAAHAGPIEIAAFGGLVPDPVNGAPDPSASRFGTELVVDAPDAAWEPRVAIEAHGSTWDGALDERRLAAVADVRRGGLVLDGFAEAQAFEPDNPWNARAVELTSAGLGAAWRRRGAHARVDATYLVPERSRRLAAALPPEWLCARTPEVPATSEECAGGDRTITSAASAGLTRGRWFLDAGAEVAGTSGIKKYVDFAGFARAGLAVLPLDGRLEIGGSAGRTSFLDWAGGEVGLAIAPMRRFDAGLRYRPEVLAYTGALDPILVHTVGADVRWGARRDLDLAVSAAVTAGADRDALTVLSTIVWRIGN